MSEEIQLDLRRAHRDGNARLTYFLLAAAGAAIGLAVQQTQAAVISWTQIPLGLAVVFWGTSFFFGCRQVDETLSSLRINHEILEIKRGASDIAGQDFNLQTVGVSTGREAFTRVAKRAERYARLQFELLIVGCVLYVAWHVLNMYLRTT